MTIQPLRRANRREILEIEALIVAALGAFRGQVAASNLLETYIDNSRAIADRWDDAEVLVAEVDGRIAGTVTWYADASREELALPREWAGFRTLAVHPALRGYGLGRKLVNECVRRSCRSRVVSVGIHSAAFMAAACRIYETAGFRRSPEYDLSAAEIFNCPPVLGDVRVIAYRLDLDHVLD